MAPSKTARGKGKKPATTPAGSAPVNQKKPVVVAAMSMASVSESVRILQDIAYLGAEKLNLEGERLIEVAFKQHANPLDLISLWRIRDSLRCQTNMLIGLKPRPEHWKAAFLDVKFDEMLHRAWCIAASEAHLVEAAMSKLLELYNPACLDHMHAEQHGLDTANLPDCNPMTPEAKIVMPAVIKNSRVTAEEHKRIAGIVAYHRSMGGYKVCPCGKEHGMEDINAAMEHESL